MLKQNDLPFTTGRAAFLDGLPGSEERTGRIYIRIVAPPLDQEILAAVDTGAPWLILEPEIAEALGLYASGGFEIEELNTKWGKKSGALDRIEVILVADEGDPLAIEATVFVCRDWPEGMNFVGYTGVLERVRFAVDPESNSFFFGPAD